nr:cytoplasmic dynein 2 intermediate chain 1 isoform X2 [Doryrhamphus excisus]
MEDTWTAAELKRHLSRKKDEHDRKHRGGDSTERRHRDPDWESTDRHGDRRDARNWDRKEDRERRRERDRQGRHGHDSREDRDKRKDQMRHDKDRLRDGRDEEDRHRRREDRERRREERDRERRTGQDRRTHEEREHREGDMDLERRREDKERRREERDRRTHEETEDREGDIDLERREDKERRREERDRERRTERDRRTHEREHKEGDIDMERRREDKERRREERDRRTHEEREDREGDIDLERRREDKERRREERDRERRIERDRRTHEREHREGDMDLERRREDKERRREERDRERRTERDRRTHDEREKREGDVDLERRRDDRDRRERQEDRKHSRVEREQQRKHKEERETRHKDRRHHDERRRRDLEEGAEALRHRRGDEEHAERDRRRERRHREDSETHPRDGHQDKQSPSQERRSVKKAEEHVMHSGDVAAQEAGDAEQPVAIDESLQQYEDDFEDYEEDFEELDEKDKDGKEEEEEVKAIQRAMGEENQRVRASLSSLSREEEEKMPEVKSPAQKPGRSSQRGKFMDFVAARQREVIKKVSSKQKKRSAELLRLIDLDLSTTMSLLDLPPVSEYDMYIRNFGAANTKQAYVQCNEDNVDRDVQTEEIDISEKWTQHPAEHCGACGDPSGSHDTQDMSGVNLDSRRLATFLRSASQVMVVLLEEDHAQKTSFKGRSTQTDTLSFSDGSVQLNTKLPFLDGRTISVLHFSPVQRHTLLSVHQPALSPGAVVQLDHCSIICIWRIWEPSRPQKILLVESEVTCCCFSPGKSTLVFAGTSIGSVGLWDLREPDGDHERLKVGEDEWTFRRPTFSTDALSAAHFSSVTSVEVVPASVPGRPGSEVPLLASEEELLGLSFQLASLDESGLLNIWVVLQLPKANEAGSQTDLGLRPGGKVKLLHSSSCVMSEGAWPWLADKSVPLQTLALKFLPTDCSHFFIGTSMGLVRHGTTQGLKAPPKFYSSQDFGARLVDVSAIHFSPFRPCLFLVGCGDGSVRLHQVSCDKPVAEWTDSTAGESVVSLQWSQTRPAVFCVVDAASNLHVWDLLKKDSGPLVTEHMDRLTAMAAFGDPGQQNAYSGIATAQHSGKIEMHYFTHDFSLPSYEEDETLERISQAL